jgi:hypothetical protein
MWTPSETVAPTQWENVAKNVLQNINTYHPNPHNVQGPSQNPNSEGMHQQVDDIGQIPYQNGHLYGCLPCCGIC